MDLPIEAFWTDFITRAAVCGMYLSICLLAFCAVFSQIADRGRQR